jgi:hypothetical protein
MKKLLLTFIFPFSIFSCTKSFVEKDVVGVYTPVEYKNCYDTIQLLQGGVYFRKVYDTNKKILLNIKSKYELRNEGSQIFFHSYFLNLDRDLVKFPELVNDTLGVALLNLEKNKGKIGFCTGYYSASLPNQNCFQKQK